MDKIKVLCFSQWYPLAIARYWENALKRNPNLEVLTTGPYTGSWIPWMGGMNLDEKYAKAPNYTLPFKPGTGLLIDYEFVKAQLPKEWHPDLILCVDAGANWKNRPQEGIVVTVATDGHCLDYTHARAISDYFFNMHPAYSMPQDKLLSYAFDPAVHYATSNEKDTDAVLIGMPYPQRVNWVKRLRQADVSVLFENGPVFDEYRELNNRARIGLNWSSMDDCNARVFELMAMRLCPVINRVPDLQRYGFIEGEHYLGFSSLDEAVEKVLYAKNEPEWAKAMSLSAYNKVHKDNFTYDRLLKDILREADIG